MGYKMKSRDTEDVYRKVPINQIPWYREDPPDALVELVENGRIQPCRCIDLGCGTGNYSRYLSKKGFTVTGIDISPSAIRIAKESARENGVMCDFITADVLHAGDQIQGTFDFAFDWEVLHHVFPQKRKRYVESVFSLLNPGGTYLSVCFSDKDTQFGGKGKYRHTPLGTHLYFSSEHELRRLFEGFFRIAKLRTIEITGKKSSHSANYALMEKSSCS
jgi:2-polyprenyl-3-methyl-5-hydroxy-6-metoxy-1,4-benzoquinol methylase